MMRRWIAVLTVVAQIATLAPAPEVWAATKKARTAAKSAKAGAPAASAAASSGGSGGVALLPLAGSGASATNRDLLGQFLRQRLVDAGQAPADAEATRAAAAEAAGGGACEDADCAARVGIALSVARVVLASVTRNGTKRRLTISVIDAATGQTAFSESGDAANEDELFTTLGSIADPLIAHLVQPPAARAPITSSRTPAPRTTAAAPSRAGAPRIEHDAPTSADADLPLVIEARVLPALGSHMLFAVHRVRGESSFRLERMTPGDDGVLRAEIPGAPAGSTIEYSLQAMDASGKQVARLPAGEDLLSVAVGGAVAPPAAMVAEPTAEVTKASKKEQARAAKQSKVRAAKQPKVRAAKPAKKPKEESVAAEESGKKGGKKWLWIGAGLAAAGLGAAMAGGGGGGGGGGTGGPPPGPAGALPRPPGRP